MDVTVICLIYDIQCYICMVYMGTTGRGKNIRKQQMKRKKITTKEQKHMQSCPVLMCLLY